MQVFWCQMRRKKNVQVWLGGGVGEAGSQNFPDPSSGSDWGHSNVMIRTCKTCLICHHLMGIEVSRPEIKISGARNISSHQ